MKRTLILIGAIIVLLAGLALLVLPGPGLPLIALALVILATEIPAVRRWLNKAIHKLPISEEKKEKLRFTIARIQKHVE